MNSGENKKLHDIITKIHVIVSSCKEQPEKLDIEIGIDQDKALAEIYQITAEIEENRELK